MLLLIHFFISLLLILLITYLLLLLLSFCVPPIVFNYLSPVCFIVTCHTLFLPICLTVTCFFVDVVSIYFVVTIPLTSTAVIKSTLSKVSINSINISISGVRIFNNLPRKISIPKNTISVCVQACSYEHMIHKKL